MTWQCYFIEAPEMASYEFDGKTYYYVDMSKLRVGALWYPRGDDGKLVTTERMRGMHLSEYYWRHNYPHRMPLIVALPCMCSTGAAIQTFSVDGMCYNREQGYYGGWQVSGEPPNITLTPSINIVGSYHGYIRDGVITPDCEGRTYPGL